MTEARVRAREHVLRTMRDARGRWYGKCTTCPVLTDPFTTRDYLVKYGPADHARKHRLQVPGKFA